jgi:hypothetical protein
VSYPNFRDWRGAQRSFSTLAWNGTTTNVSDEGHAPERSGRRATRLDPVHALRVE